MGLVVVWKSPVSVEGDANETFLLFLELFTVNLDRARVRENDTVTNTIERDNKVSRLTGYFSGNDAVECTYIQGSVSELPSGDLVRSLLRPGAKTPRP